MRLFALVTTFAFVCSACDPAGKVPPLPDNWVLTRRDGQLLTIDFVPCEPLANVIGVEIIVKSWPDNGRPITRNVAKYVGESAPTFPLRISTESTTEVAVIDPAGVKSILEETENVSVRIQVLLADGSRVEGTFWAETLANVRPGEFDTVGGSVPRDGLCSRRSWESTSATTTHSEAG